MRFPPEKAQAGELISSLGVSTSTCASTIGIPLDELADQLAELPDDQDIVAYCRGAYCVLAHEAVRLLTDHGRSAMRLADGMLEWRLADLPVAT